MTGAEHYAVAERMLNVAEAELRDASIERDPKVSERHLRQSEIAQQRAQVHATLALAAATVDGSPAIHVSWAEVVR